MDIADNTSTITIQDLADKKLNKKYSDKGKWFGDRDQTTYIKCTMDNFLDFMTAVFNGNREKARNIAPQFHRASLGEFIENKLYEL